MESHLYRISNADELKHKIRFLRNKSPPIPSVIELAPGTYDINLRLPAFLKIKGSGIGLTILNLLDTFFLESNNYLEDITINYFQDIDNLLDIKVRELFSLDCKSYLDIEEDVIYDNTVYLKNVEINLYNINSGYIWYIIKGNLNLENVKITHQVTREIDMLEEDILSLFNVGNFSLLKLHNCVIDFQSETQNTYLFNGDISKFHISHSHIKLYSTTELEQSYIFYVCYTKIKIMFSQIENLCNQGNLFFADTELELELSHILSNFLIQQGKMNIEKVREEEYFEKMLDRVEGILFEKKKLIFGKCINTPDSLQIEVRYPDNTIPCNLDLVRDPEYLPLILLDISDTELYVNNDTNFLDLLEEYYVVVLKNVVNRNQSIHKNLNLVGDREWNYDYKKGELDLNSISTNLLSQVSLHHVCRQDKGYSMLPKKVVGPESIDFTVGDSLVTGSFNYASGHQNQVDGSYATVLGNNNLVLSSNSLTLGNNLVNKFNDCILLGRFNIPEYDWKQKLFVVGNGIAEKKSDALVIYETGEVEVYNSFRSTHITDGITKIQEGNIKEVKNIEVEENIFINQDLLVEGEIKGATVIENNVPMDVIQIAGEKITTWKLDLAKFSSPEQYGNVLNLLDCDSNYLARLDEKTHGIIYQMEVTCVETPNRKDLRFILSKNKFWKGSDSRPGNKKDNNFIDIISSYEWKKGKRIVENNRFEDEYNYGGLPYYLYLARETSHRKYRDFGEKQLQGKFLVRIKGIELF